MSKKNRTGILVLLLAALLTPTPLLAEEPAEAGIQLREGQWLFNVHIQMPMQSKPTVQKFKTCITNDPVTASTLMPWAESQGCKIRNAKVAGDRLTWKLRCRKSGQRSRGQGEFEVDGDRAEGKARINFEMGGRRMSVVTEWEAERVGECSETTAVESSPSTVEPDNDE